MLPNLFHILKPQRKSTVNTCSSFFIKSHKISWGALVGLLRTTKDLRLYPNFLLTSWPAHLYTDSWSETVRVSFMCQSAWTSKCPDIWPKIMTDVPVSMILNEVNIWIRTLEFGQNAMGWIVSPQNIYVETLASNVTVSGDRTFRR